MLHQMFSHLPSAPPFRPTRDDPNCLQMSRLWQVKLDILELVYIRPEFGGVRSPVPGVEDEVVKSAAT